jgi:hypothetical protein
LAGFEEVLEMLSNHPHTKTQLNLDYHILNLWFLLTPTSNLRHTSDVQKLIVITGKGKLKYKKET